MIQLIISSDKSMKEGIKLSALFLPFLLLLEGKSFGKLNVKPYVCTSQWPLLSVMFMSDAYRWFIVLFNLHLQLWLMYLSKKKKKLWLMWQGSCFLLFIVFY